MPETPQRLLPVSVRTTDGRDAGGLSPGERCILASGRPGGRPASGAVVVAIPRGLLWGSFLALTVLFAATLVWGQAQRIQFRSQMTVEEFERCGLAKLTPQELASLETWIARRAPGMKTAPSDPIAAPTAFAPSAGRLGSAPSSSGEAGDPLVAFNVSTHKYHCPSCRFALQCTKNCIEIPRSQALARGGVACGSCGGACR